MSEEINKDFPGQVSATDSTQLIGTSPKWFIVGIWGVLTAIGITRALNKEVYAITSYDVFGRGVLHVLIALVVLLAIIRGLISRFSGSSSFQRLQFVDKAGRVLIHFLLAFIVAFLSFDALRGM